MTLDEQLEKKVDVTSFELEKDKLQNTIYDLTQKIALLDNKLTNGFLTSRISIQRDCSMFDATGMVLKRREEKGAELLTGDIVFLGIKDNGTFTTIILLNKYKISGKVIIIKDEDGVAGTRQINVRGENGETIDNVTTMPINTDYGVLRLYSDGNNWFTF